jgi:chromosomal replication initiator protein
VVYGVTQIDLPRRSWSAPLRVDRACDSHNELPCFIAGPENQLAGHVLRQLLSGEHPRIPSPLVLSGPTGSGKSFMAHAIVRRWSELLSESQVQYFTAIDFGREVRAAQNDNTLNSFRDRLAQLKLLVVEDLQLLAKSSFIQLELRNILDRLFDSTAVVIVTSQQSPSLLPNMEASLRDRFNGGLTIRLQYPGLEAREAFLELAASSRSFPLNSCQRQSLAQKSSGPVSHLFRALHLQQLQLTTDSAVQSSQPIELKQIIALVARYFSLTQASLRSPSRRKSLVYARSVIIYLARSLTNLSYAQIGQRLGGRDHSTVMHAFKSLEKQITTDLNTQQTIEELRRILTAV